MPTWLVIQTIFLSVHMIQLVLMKYFGINLESIVYGRNYVTQTLLGDILIQSLPLLF